MLSKTVEYALRAVVYLASRPDEPAATDEVAERTRVPAPYLAKVLQALTRKGLVKSQRGVGGGVTLAKPANELTILEVVNAVEPLGRITTCPLGLASHGTRLCPLHKKLDTALASVEEAFGSTTLADVLGESTGSVPLCDGPADKKRVPLKLRR